MAKKNSKNSDPEINIRKKKSSKVHSDESIPKDEREIEEMLENEMLGEPEVEDDEEFIQNVEEFKKEHSKDKMVSVYIKIGKPKIIELKKLDAQKLKEELKKLIVLLDKHNIIVHSHGDFDDKEKYRFITEEIIKEVVEDNKKKHVTFVYEDYHPEMDDDDDDDIYDENY